MCLTAVLCVTLHGQIEAMGYLWMLLAGYERCEKHWVGGRGKGVALRKALSAPSQRFSKETEYKYSDLYFS